MRRSGFFVLILALLALPAAAQPQSTPACGKAAFGSSSIEGLQGATTYQPLAAEQRLFYGLSGLGVEALEVRYFVQGKIHLTETVDLSAAKLPQINLQDRKPALESKDALELQRLLEGERMMELLALRPDLVKQLHELARGGARIEVKVFEADRRVESLSFEELTRRSAELRNSPAVPVVVQSAVRGPGDRREPERSLFTKVYLPDCGDCTTAMPCDTECGWDPGKGGPVTCGEYGVCVGAGCSCQVSHEYWTSWYLVSSSPSYSDCLHSRWGGSAWHQLYNRQFRRDRIRQSTICPNCPECNGCYVQNEVISYQLGSDSCFYETGGSCGFGRRPGCYELCDVYYNTPCN